MSWLESKGAAYCQHKMNDGNGLSVESGTDAQDQREWDAMFKRLQAFKRQQGHCNVPEVYAPDQQLADWVQLQQWMIELAAADDL